MKKAFLLSAALLVIVVLALFFWPALYALHLRWIRLDEPYAIGYATVFLSAWWLFDRRHRLLNTVLAPSYSAWPLLLAALLFSAAAGLIYFQIIQQLAIPIVLWLIVAATMGWRAAKAVRAPLAVLYLAIPFLDIGDPLRTMTVWFCQHVLDALHIPAMIDAYRIVLPAGIIEVAGSCSGFNLLLASIFMGLLQGEMGRQSVGRRALLVAVAALIGILDNWIRVLALVLLAFYTDMKHDLIYHHGSFGWWIFAISMLIYIPLSLKLEGPPKPRPNVPVHPSAVAWLAMAKMMLIVAVSIASVHWAKIQLEGRVGSLRGFNAPANAIAARSGWLPDYRGQDVTQQWTLFDAGRNYQLATLIYTQQTAEKKLIYYRNVIAPEAQLKREGHIVVEGDFAVRSAVIRDNTWRAVWWFWWVDNHTSTRSIFTKLRQLQAMLLGDPSAALIAVTTECRRAGCEEELNEPPIQLLQRMRQLPPITSSLTSAP